MHEGTSAGAGDDPGDDRRLLDAVLALGSDLDPQGVLQRLVSSACALTGAPGGVLAVLDPDGTVGARVGPGPSPQRAADPLAERRPTPGSDPASPESLEVPVRVRGELFGTLHLTRRTDGAGPGAGDERLVDALVRAAGPVIDHARTWRRSERDRAWLEAAADAGEALQTGEGGWDGIAVAARRAADARWSLVVRPEDDGCQVLALAGEEPPTVDVLRRELEEPLRRSDGSGEAVVTGHAGAPVLLVPLCARLADRCVLLLAWAPGERRPDTEEVARAVRFAEGAAMGLDRTRALRERQELMLLADRDRIARDLHDLVIQRLFATGLQLQGVHRITASDGVRTRVDDAVAELDLTIRDIRSTIFELQHKRETSFRAEVRSLVKEYEPVLGFTPLVLTTGPVDDGLPEQLGDQLLATLREGLSNVARHARADACVVEVELAERSLTLSVADNGDGMPSETHESGLRNARRRAAERGGRLRLLPGDPRGTRLEWAVPVAAAAG